MDFKKLLSASATKTGSTATRESGQAASGLVKPVTCVTGDDGDSDVDIDDPFGEFHIDEDLDDEIPNGVQIEKTKGNADVSTVSMDFSDAPNDPECNSFGMDFPVSTMQHTEAPTDPDVPANVAARPLHIGRPDTSTPTEAPSGTFAGAAEATDSVMQDIPDGSNHQNASALGSNNVARYERNEACGSLEVCDEEMAADRGTEEHQCEHGKVPAACLPQNHPPVPAVGTHTGTGHATQYSKAQDGCTEDTRQVNDAVRDTHSTEHHDADQANKGSNTFAPTTGDDITDPLVPTFWDNTPPDTSASPYDSAPLQPDLHSYSAVGLPATAGLEPDRGRTAPATLPGGALAEALGSSLPATHPSNNNPGETHTIYSHQDREVQEKEAPMLHTGKAMQANPHAAAQSLQTANPGSTIADDDPEQVACESVQAAQGSTVHTGAQSCVQADPPAEHPTDTAPPHSCTDDNPCMPLSEPAAQHGTMQTRVVDEGSEHQLASHERSKCNPASVAPPAPQAAPHQVSGDTVAASTVVAPQNQMTKPTLATSQPRLVHARASEIVLGTIVLPARSEPATSSAVSSQVHVSEALPNNGFQHESAFQPPFYGSGKSAEGSSTPHTQSCSSFAEWLPSKPAAHRAAESELQSTARRNTNVDTTVGPTPLHPPTNSNEAGPATATKSSKPCSDSSAAAISGASESYPVLPERALPSSIAITQYTHEPHTKPNTLPSHKPSIMSAQRKLPVGGSTLGKAVAGPTPSQNLDHHAAPAKRKSGSEREPEVPKQLRIAVNSDSLPAAIRAASDVTVSKSSEFDNHAPMILDAEPSAARPVGRVLQDTTNRPRAPQGCNPDGASKKPYESSKLMASPMKISVPPKSTSQSRAPCTEPEASEQQVNALALTSVTKEGSLSKGQNMDKADAMPAVQDCITMNGAQAIASLSKYRKEIAELTLSMQEIGIRVEAAADEALELRVDAAVLKNRWARLAQPETVGTVREELETARRFLQQAESAAASATNKAERMGWLKKQPDAMDCDR